MGKHEAAQETPPPRHVLLALDWYSQQYHRGVASYAKRTGWSLDAGTVHVRSKRMRREYAELAKSYDGIICCLTGDPDMRELVLQAQLPTVDLGAQDLDIKLPRVVLDNHAIGRLAAETFLQRGFRNLAFCRAELHTASQERCQGFAETCADRETECMVLDWHDHSRKRDRRNRDLMIRWFGERLSALPKPLAVMTTNDDEAVLMLDACQKMGLLVPEQVAIIGCDNEELVCQFARIPLSSVDPCLEEQARQGAAVLDRLMRGETVPDEPIRVPPRGVVIRQSSDILAIENVAVAGALRFIWNRYTDPNLAVPQVAEAAGLSVRGLCKSFRQYLGRSVSQEIRRLRLERAQQLMKRGDLTFYQVADRCGFTSGKHLRETLKRDTGQTPRQYRKRSAGNPGR